MTSRCINTSNKARLRHRLAAISLGELEKWRINCTRPACSPRAAVQWRSMSYRLPFFQQTLQILAITILGQGLGQARQLRRIDKSFAVCNLFRARHFQALAMLYRRDKVAGLDQAFMRARIEPSVTTPHDLDIQLLALQIYPVDVSNFQFAARRWLQLGGNLDDLIIVKIQTSHRIVTLRCERLFFQAGGLAVGIEIDDAIALRVLHMIGKHGGAGLMRRRLLQLKLQIMAIENIIAKYEGTRAIANKFLADNKCLRQAIGAFLHCIFELQAPCAAIAQQLLETWRILWRRDNQNLAYASQHQGAERIINHRLVINWQQLLGHCHGDGIQARPRPSGQDDAFTFSHDYFSRNSVSIRLTPIRQSGRVMSNACCTFCRSRREFFGRGAGVGKALLATASIASGATFKSTPAWRARSITKLA